MAISNDGEKEGLLIKMITQFERIKTNYQADQQNDPLI